MIRLYFKVPGNFYAFHFRGYIYFFFRGYIYIYIWYVNSLEVNQFLNELFELICLHAVERFQVFLFKTNNFI